MHHAHKKAITAFCQQLWMSDDEITVYIAVLDLRRATVLQIAKMTTILRVTVHNCVKKLLERWLIEEEWFSKKRYLVPAAVEHISSIVEEKKKATEQLEASFMNIGSILTDTIWLTVQMPEVKLYDGATGMRSMLARTKQEQGTMYVISDSKKFTTYLTTYEVRKSYEARAKRGNETYLLVAEDFDDIRWPEYDKYNVHLKTLPLGTVVGGSINIWWSSVYFHVHQWEHGATILIDSQVIAQMMMVLRRTLRNK